MTDPRNKGARSMNLDDAESIARLLDGRATAAERQRLLERADASPELLAILADAAAIHEAERGSSSGRLTDIGTRRWRITPRRIAAIAAVLIVAATIPVVWKPGALIPPFGGIDARVAQQLATSAVDGAPRATTRGTPSATRQKLSSDVGSRVADYLVLAQSNNPAASSVALEIASSLGTIPGGGAAAAQFEALTRSADAELRAHAVSGAEHLLDAQRFRAGIWVEFVRLAAASRSTDWLKQSNIGSAIARVSRGPFSSAARATARQLSDALGAPQPSPASIEETAGALLRELRQ